MARIDKIGAYPESDGFDSLAPQREPQFTTIIQLKELELVKTKLLSFSAILLLILATIGSSQVQTETPGRDPVREEPYLKDLQKIAPMSVETFKTATQSLDSGDAAKAVTLYNEVLLKAPNFEPAIRRLGYALVATGKRSEGIAMLQKTVDMNRSADNLLGLASSIVSPGIDQYVPPESEVQRALTLAEESVKIGDGKDPDAIALVAQLALSTEMIDTFNRSVSQLRDKYPNELSTHYFYSLKLANDGDIDSAIIELRKAEALGFSHDEASQMIAMMEKYKEDSAFFGYGAYAKYVYIAFALVALWAVGLSLLFVIGKVLSKQTLDSIESSDPNDISGGGQARLRDIYRKVITFAGIYYYLSQPFVIFLVIALTVGIIFMFLIIGTIPIKIVFVLAFVALASIFYMIKSLIFRPKAEDPGRALTESEAPDLWKMVREVAATLQTRPVDEIRITHGADLAVYERGGFRAKMSDSAERILILGAAVLNDFDQNAFRAVLAHEYGHFSNRDTAGGDIAFRVNMDIMRVAESMAKGGTATFYNLGFQFLRLFHFLFRRITHGATRLQEILADRVAAHNYGVSAFKDGLSHVIRRELEFKHLALKEINDASRGNRALANIYELSVQEDDAVKDLEEQFTSAVNMTTTEDDTHPSPVDRFKYIERIRSKQVVPLSGVVWDLFADKNAITAEMNSVVEKLAFAGVE